MLLVNELLDCMTPYTISMNNNDYYCFYVAFLVYY